MGSRDIVALSIQAESWGKDHPGRDSAQGGHREDFADVGSRRPSWAQGQTSQIQPHCSIPPRMLTPPTPGIPPLPHWCSLNRDVWPGVQLVTSICTAPPWLCLVPADTWARRRESEEQRHSAGGCLVCRGGRVTSAQTPRWRWTAHAGRCPLKTIPDKCHCADGRHFVFFKKKFEEFLL